MFEDPIVEEVHKAREKIWKEAGESMQGLMKYYEHQRETADYTDRLISPEQVRQVKKLENKEPAIG